MIKKQVLYYFLLLMLMADLGYSFVQHLSQPLDGDMAWNIVPENDAKPTLKDPFGFGAIVHDHCYPNPNRFFGQYTMKEYFDFVPLAMQEWVSPIDSIYLSCALAKTLVQLMIIILLAVAITGKTDFRNTDVLVAAVLVTPLFQTEGYQGYMGIIDRSPTYVFFYALPAAFLLLYFLPFFLQYFHERKPSGLPLIYLLWIPFALVLCLSGPLNPGIVLIASLLLFTGMMYLNYIQSNQPAIYKRIFSSILGIPKNYWFYLLPISIFALYSLYLGSYNSNNMPVPLGELYSRIPEGILNPLTKKLGFPVLFFILGLNLVIIGRYYKTAAGKKILRFSKWAGIFALIYILLLPLGGYRENRINIIRYDTVMPVTLTLIFLFGLSALFLFKNLPGMQKRWYIPLICGVLLLYTLNDEPQFDKNRCERMALKVISASPSNVVPLKNDCTVLSWKVILKPEDSRLNARLLIRWKVIEHEKLFYYAPTSY